MNTPNKAIAASELHKKLGKYIVIEGPIGVGKTSLACKLANSLNATLMLEKTLQNPFLERFYRNPRAAALATQLAFLLERSTLINDMLQDDLFTPQVISDFSITKNHIFAEHTLDHAERQLFNQLYDQLIINEPLPDLMIYLQAPVKVLREHIDKRGISYERYIETSYLEKMCESYMRYFRNYQDSPLLIINCADVNFIDDDKAYQQLLDLVGAPIRGRQYFNANNF